MATTNTRKGHAAKAAAPTTTNGANVAQVQGAANALLQQRSKGYSVTGRVPAYLQAVKPGSPTYKACRAVPVSTLRNAAKGQAPVPATVRATKGSYTLAIGKARAGSPGNWPWAVGLVAVYVAAHCKGAKHTGPAAS